MQDRIRGSLFSLSLGFTDLHIGDGVGDPHLKDHVVEAVYIDKGDQRILVGMIVEGYFIIVLGEGVACRVTPPEEHDCRFSALSPPKNRINFFRGGASAVVLGKALLPRRDNTGIRLAYISQAFSRRI